MEKIWVRDLTLVASYLRSTGQFEAANRIKDVIIGPDKKKFRYFKSSKALSSLKDLIREAKNCDFVP